LITKGASADGSVIVTHSDDDELSDQRIVYVPAQDHPAGAQRPILLSDSFDYPRLVIKGRAPAYDTPGYAPTKILGYIPQVRHTYAYFDGNYGIMNEHQLMIGECTDGARNQPKAKAGKRMFYSSELSRIALERTKTAREAVKLMGGLIDKYGYYSTGETLLVGDTKEGWVMEMCASPEDENTGIWVAQRVPDGQVFAAANEFRIREVRLDLPGMMVSENLKKIIKSKGFGPNKPLDWLEYVSLGEYNHPYYSLRRVWRVFSLLNPGLKLSPWVENAYTKAYPFAIKPAKKLTVADAMRLHRDHYEGTEFDMTRGLAAGPFGTPTRYLGPYDGAGGDVNLPKNLKGAWERPLAMYYMGYSYALQARGGLPSPIGGVAWIGLDVSYTTCYMPFYAGVKDLPLSLQTGSPQEFDRSKAWWAFNFVANWAELKFQYMIKDILPKQRELESLQFATQPAIETAALQLYKKDPALARKFLTDYCSDNAARVVKEWWALADMLIVKYDDGYISTPEKIAQEVGYPKWWRYKVGWQRGPISYQKPQAK
jgi:dipeptidase